MLGNKTEQVEGAAIIALEKMKASPQKKKKGGAIYKKACELDPSYVSQVSENVFKSYLSGLSRKQSSRIVKDAGSHGYYLKDPLPEAENALALSKDDGVAEPDQKKERKENEKLLYPILEAWLQSQGYRTKDTSTMKGMGRWGNPDITGIIVDESLGSFDIELVTIEAKITHLNFRYDFFEAVSHKRFSNRVYFAFAATSNFLRENHDELRYYSELYGVGVVVIAIEEPHFKKYEEGELKEVDTDLVDVYEVFSAIHEPRLRRWQKSFLEQLNINSTKDLWSWGNA